MNEIDIFRGNSLNLEISLRDEGTGEPIILGEGESIIFTVKSTLHRTIMEKVITPSDYDSEVGAYILALTPDDTLDVLPSTYNYDCLYISSSGEAYTFVSSTLNIKPVCGTIPEEE